MIRALLAILALTGLLAGCATERADANAPPFASSGNHDIFDSLSPELGRILTEHAAAKTILSDAFAKAFAGKRVQLYYFYSSKANKARGYHFYRGDRFVIIAVQQSENPWDEFLVILYETLNSLNEAKLIKLARAAERGKISRAEFPIEVLNLEHQAVKRTRDLIRKLNLSEAVAMESEFHRRFLASPDDFDAFLAYVTSPENGRNPVLEYQQMYDENLRQ